MRRIFAASSFVFVALVFGCRSEHEHVSREHSPSQGGASSASAKPVEAKPSAPIVVPAPKAGAPASNTTSMSSDSASARADANSPRAGERSLHFGDSATPRELAPIFAGTTYDANIPTPDSTLRQPLGTFTAHHAELLTYLRALERASPKIRVVTTGRTHEGRELVYAVIASREHMAQLDSIRANIAKLADPRTTNDAEAEHIIGDTPAIAWLGYSIHGDEMSGCDASLAVAYHLVAGTSADVDEILSNVVVVIDPAQNPDGRERILSQLEQGAGYVPNLDDSSMSRGRWPHGRGNHYLFDMNRDWIWGTQPETRARWAAIQSFHPQLLVDAHEMGAEDTFLFYPATDPFTPWFPQHTRTWWQRFAADQAAAFDAHGWSYYTREWADSWYPGYTDSWGTFIGAVGILYEQARYMGQSVRRPSGEIATYRDAVARQATGSMANVTTLSKNRAAMLRDYYAAKKQNVAADTTGNDRTLVLALGRNPEREAAFVRMLSAQGIEVFRSTAEFSAKNVETTLVGKLDQRTFPAGTVLVPARQPLAPMVKAFLAFDPRYDKASLERERKELERKQRSKAYDVTGWSPAHAYDLDAAWCDALDVASTRIRELDPLPRGVVDAEVSTAPVYAWAVDGDEDAAVVFAARAMELGAQVNAADEPFTARGRVFPRGSLLVRRVENAADIADKVKRAAESAGTRAFALTTGRSIDDTPDLGGQHFKLLSRPRIAIVSNAPISTDAFGHSWHLIDDILGEPVTLIDAQEFGGYDLRRYNVIVVPDGGLGEVLHDNAEGLMTWMQGGGTLIASGRSASDMCDPELKLTTTRLRPQMLEKLDEYALSVKREREAGRTTIDESLLWDGKPTKKDEKPDDKKTADATPGEKGDKGGDKPSADKKSGDAKDDAKEDLVGKEDKARRDSYQRTFSPQGVILRGEVNVDSWLTYGCRDELPVFFSGSNVFVSQRPVQTAVRIANAERMRLSGLLWPEARERIADSGYAMVERKGAGQLILFATPPDFRNWFAGTMRLLSNAVVYGPGLGADQPSAW